MATQSDDDPEKRANDTNELSATVQSTLFHLHGDFILSFVSRVLFSQISQCEQSVFVGLCHTFRT